jgi:hypothetical protein
VAVADSPADRAAKKLAWDIESRRSIEIRVRTDISPPTNRNVGRPMDFNAYVDHYIDTASGQRFNERTNLKGETAVDRAEDYGDGSRFAHVQFVRTKLDVQQTVAINRQYFQEESIDRKNLPIPLLYEFVGRQPLHKALAKAEQLGETKVLGRTCDAFLFRNVRWIITHDQVFYLDRESAIPLKVVAYRDEATRLRDEPMWSWTAESLDEKGGHRFVGNSTQVGFGPEKKPTNMWKYHVEEIAFDKTYPASMFWPTIQPEATVLDSFTKTIKSSSTKTSAPAPSTPITKSAPALPPSNWLSYLPAVMLSGGLVILLVAIIVWRRSR